VEGNCDFLPLFYFWKKLKKNGMEWNGMEWNGRKETATPGKSG
jgi:hypothetical protein